MTKWCHRNHLLLFISATLAIQLVISQGNPAPCLSMQQLSQGLPERSGYSTVTQQCGQAGVWIWVSLIQVLHSSHFTILALSDQCLLKKYFQSWNIMEKNNATNAGCTISTMRQICTVWKCSQLDRCVYNRTTLSPQAAFQRKVLVTIVA